MTRAVLIGLVLAACGTNGPTVEQLAAIPDAAPTLLVDVGGGMLEFEELSDGQEVDLVYGPQGGFHIWTSVRVHDVTIGEAQINLYARYEDGTLAGTPSRVATPLGEQPGGKRVVYGLRNFITDADAARGKRIVLRVEVVASGDRHGAGEKVVTAR